jgi:hypothetical protein
MTIDQAQLALAIASPALSAIVGLVIWSVKRTLHTQDQTLERIAADLRQISGTVGAHTVQLAEGGVTIRGLTARVDGLEDRERQRGCFAACPVHGQAPRPQR